MDFFCELLANLFYLPIEILNIVGVVASSVTSTGGDSIIGEISGLLNSATANLSVSLQGFGYSICIMFFIFSLIDLVTSERLTLELFIKHFAKMGLGMGMVYYAPDFCTLIVKLGNDFASLIAINSINVSNTSVSGVDALTEMFKQNSGDKPFYVIGLLVTSVPLGAVLCIISLLLVIVVYVIALTRIIELNLRGALLPIGLALMSDDGFRGAGGRFFKKFVSICCQGGIIALIGRISTGCITLAANKQITVLVSAKATDGFLEMMSAVLGCEAVIIGVGLATVAAMFKSIQLTNDAFGA